MIALTKRQASILGFIIDHIKEWGYAPTMREIGAHFDIGSTNGVNDHLRCLERKGYIVRDYGLSRAIQVKKGVEGIPLLPKDIILSAVFRTVTKKLIHAGVYSDTLTQVKALFDSAAEL